MLVWTDQPTGERERDGSNIIRVDHRGVEPRSVEHETWLGMDVAYGACLPHIPPIARGAQWDQAGHLVTMLVVDGLVRSAGYHRA
jgi:hypothetical protein